MVVTIFIGILSRSSYIGGVWTKLNSSETQSIVNGQNDSSWKPQAVHIAGGENIHRYYFFNESVIYGINYENFVSTIYKTSDGAKSWEKQSSFDNFAIDDVFFVTADEGFIVLSKIKTESMPDKDASRILKTGDGGLSWKTVYSSPDTTFEKIIFNPDGIGIVTGSRKIPDRPSNLTGTLFLTNDMGETWKDISEPVNNKLKLSVGQFADSAANVIFSKDKGIVVLSLRGKLFRNNDEGKSWSLISGIMSEPDQTGFSNLGELEDGTYLVTGGTMSIEGKWGVIAVLNKRLGWDIYRLNDYYFSDVRFLSNNEVIAAGTKFPPTGAGAGEQKKGVILYSADSGKTWSTIYEDQTSKSFYINKLSANKLFIFGENGAQILLERP